MEQTVHQEYRAASESFIRDALGRLAELAQLASDWDSYGAAPPSPAAIAKAQQLLIAVDRQFSGEVGERVQPYAVAPIADGSIQLEWRGPHAEAEVDIDAVGQIGYLFVDKQGRDRTLDEKDNAPWSEVVDVIGKALLPAA